jgi:hypothetical protein
MVLHLNADAWSSAKNGARYMQFSNEFFQNIVGHSAFALDEHESKRLSHRIGIAKRATLAPGGSTPQVPATVIDLSLGGVGFICLLPCVPAEEFTLRIVGRQGQRIAVQCRVCWCSKSGSGRFQVGAEFLKLVEQSVIQPSEAEFTEAGFTSAASADTDEVAA